LTTLTLEATDLYIIKIRVNGKVQFITLNAEIYCSFAVLNEHNVYLLSYVSTFTIG